MKKFFLLTSLLLGLFAAAQNNDVVVNDANAIIRPLEEPFTSVSVATGIELLITQASEVKLAVSVSDNKYLQKLVTKVEGGELKIYLDNTGASWVFEKGRKIKAYLSVKSIERLKASSGASVNFANELKASAFSLSLSSGAKMEGTIVSSDLSVDISSGAKAKVEGKSSKVSIDVSSGAKFDGAGFNAQSCVAKASSGAHADIEVSEKLTAKASSGGRIRYSGNVSDINIDTSSGGSVRKS